MKLGSEKGIQDVPLLDAALHCQYSLRKNKVEVKIHKKFI